MWATVTQLFLRTRRSICCCDPSPSITDPDTLLHHHHQATVAQIVRAETKHHTMKRHFIPQPRLKEGCLSFLHPPSLPPSLSLSRNMYTCKEPGHHLPTNGGKGRTQEQLSTLLSTVSLSLSLYLYPSLLLLLSLPLSLILLLSLSRSAC